MFGWLSSEIIDYLLECGVKEFYYVGNCGALSVKYKIGDVLYPNRVYNMYNRFIDVKNIFCEINETNKHISVETPALETKKVIAELRDKKMNTIDVELYGIMKTISKYDRIKFGVSLLISDFPGKKLQNNVLVYNNRIFKKQLTQELKKILDIIF